MTSRTLEVICNTSPVQYLYQLGLLELLPGLYSQVTLATGGAAVDHEIWLRERRWPTRGSVEQQFQASRYLVIRRGWCGEAAQQFPRSAQLADNLLSQRAHEAPKIVTGQRFGRDPRQSELWLHFELGADFLKEQRLAG